jgi:hypothetical protein
MSAVAVVTPLVIANWPVIAAAVTAAVSTLGYTIVEAAANVSVKTKVKTTNQVEVDIDESAVVEGMTNTDTIVAVKDGVTATIKRDAHGKLSVCMEGEHLSKTELRQMGEELVGTITQQYVYHKLMTEIENKNLVMVEEEVAADRSIKIRVRNG